jgi:hypothetical protein
MVAVGPQAQGTAVGREVKAASTGCDITLWNDPQRCWLPHMPNQPDDLADSPYYRAMRAETVAAVRTQIGGALRSLYAVREPQPDRITKLLLELEQPD